MSENDPLQERRVKRMRVLDERGYIHRVHSALNIFYPKGFIGPAPIAAVDDAVARGFAEEIVEPEDATRESQH